MQTNINTQQLQKVVGLFILLLILTNIAHAQPPDPGGEVNAPIDGGLSLLIAGGIGYGVKRMRKEK
jgi:hypothetical protein